jgi:excisionase family DNA binding protein
VNESRATIIERLRGRCTCSIEEAAAVLGIGRSTAYAAAHDGTLPVFRVRNRLLVSTAKLLAMLGVESPCEGPGSAACASIRRRRDDG